MRFRRVGFVWVAVAAVALVVGGCGGGNKASSEKSTQAAAKAQGPSAKEQGEEVGKAIIAAFDGLVQKATQMITEDPNAATVMPKLDELVKDAEPQMKELNARLLALRGADVEAFGAANSYIQDHRPKSVDTMDRAFAPFLFDYPGEDPDGQVKQFLSGKSLVSLLDVATQIS